MFHLSRIHGLNPQEATYVAYIKIIIHILIQKLPPALKGGIVEMATPITDILEGAGTPQAKSRQVLNLFQSLLQVFRNDLSTSLLLDHYCRVSDWLVPQRIFLPKNR
uniref:Uncharacterized protein n=1 Tax=Panagrolaimus sp. ES5 TaxID=591445 RepID=A0AC34FD58_9BILA